MKSRVLAAHLDSSRKFLVNIRKPLPCLTSSSLCQVLDGTEGSPRPHRALCFIVKIKTSPFLWWKSDTHLSHFPRTLL